LPKFGSIPMPATLRMKTTLCVCKMILAVNY
jgi:hypothetical protein